MISRTKHTFDTYTALRKYDEPVMGLIDTFNPRLLSDDELRDILKGLLNIKLCNRTRGFTASDNQLAVIKKNVNFINCKNKSLMKLTRVVTSDSWLYKVINRYNVITLNLNKQLSFYERKIKR